MKKLYDADVALSFSGTGTTSDRVSLPSLDARAIVLDFEYDVAGTGTPEALYMQAAIDRMQVKISGSGLNDAVTVRTGQAQTYTIASAIYHNGKDNYVTASGSLAAGTGCKLVNDSAPTFGAASSHRAQYIIYANMPFASTGTTGILEIIMDTGNLAIAPTSFTCSVNVGFIVGASAGFTKSEVQSLSVATRNDVALPGYGVGFTLIETATAGDLNRIEAPNVLINNPDIITNSYNFSAGLEAGVTTTQYLIEAMFPGVTGQYLTIEGDTSEARTVYWWSTPLAAGVDNTPVQQAIPTVTSTETIMKARVPRGVRKPGLVGMLRGGL